MENPPLEQCSTLVTFHEIMVLCISGMVVITFGSCFWGPLGVRRDMTAGSKVKVNIMRDWRRCVVPSSWDWRILYSYLFNMPRYLTLPPKQ